MPEDNANQKFVAEGGDGYAAPIPAAASREPERRGAPIKPAPSRPTTTTPAQPSQGQGQGTGGQSEGQGGGQTGSGGNK
jgi:hypothetical protein